MKKFIGILVAVALIFGGYIFAVNSYLPLQNKLEKADTIVAISGGDTEGRAVHAIELYKQGWAPQLIFSGAALDPESASNARVMLAIAAANGVKSENIVLDEDSRDTSENAKKVQALIPDTQRIILVTSAYHQRRAYKKFQAEFGKDVKIINSPAQDKRWNPKTWWLTPYGWWVSTGEMIKLPF